MRVTDAERLRSDFHYDPNTGVFTYRVPRSRMRAGAVAGTLNSDGYIQIGCLGRRHRAHRLAWLYVTGDWPAQDIDHRDRDRTNNRWSNLRPATRSQNNANSGVRRTSLTGFKGVQRSLNGRFAAKLKWRGKWRCLGTYDTPQEAHLAYMDEAQKVYGEFAHASISLDVVRVGDVA